MLNYLVLDDYDGIRFIARKMSFGLNDDVFVGNRIFNACFFADHALFHDDGVFDDRALFNVNSAEKDAVFNGAVDDATVRDKAIFNLGVVKITGRNAVLDLRENRAFAIENIVPGFGVQPFHNL